jgi:hypothetical protein
MQPRNLRPLSWLFVAVVVAVIVGALVRHAATRDEQVPDELQGPWRDRSGTILPDGTERGNGFAFGVRVYQGDEHCDWERVTFMDVAWPPGSITTAPRNARQFVRDPQAELDHSATVRGDFTRDIEAPSDADPRECAPTGPRSGSPRRTRTVSTYGIRTAPSTSGRERSRRSAARSGHDRMRRDVRLVKDEPLRPDVPIGPPQAAPDLPIRDAAV